MTYSKNELVNTILLFADKFNQRNNWEELLKSDVDLPQVIKRIST